MELRALLVEFLTRYFPVSSHSKKSLVPEWLDSLCIEMQKKECFMGGLSIMHKLSHKSPEHLCRVFKKHFNKTPTGFINELKVNYAAKLLTYSDESIVNISMEAGFENLSHFYNCFKEFFSITPAEFRRINKKTMIP